MVGVETRALVRFDRREPVAIQLRNGAAVIVHVIEDAEPHV
jgi:hypothetical protein